MFRRSYYWVVNFLKQRSEQLKQLTDNELLQKYITMLTETVSMCVEATNQTYVNTLKKRGEFGIDAQKEAFQKTFDTVMSILSDEAVAYLTTFCGDITVTVSTMIEKQVAMAYTRIDVEDEK